MAPKEVNNAKRSRDGPYTLQPLTDAPNFNALVLKKLQNALEIDPEVDLISKLPTLYSERLVSKKESPETDEGKFPTNPRCVFLISDIP